MALGTWFRFPNLVHGSDSYSQNGTGTKMKRELTTRVIKGSNKKKERGLVGSFWDVGYTMFLCMRIGEVV